MEKTPPSLSVSKNTTSVRRPPSSGSAPLAKTSSFARRMLGSNSVAEASTIASSGDPSLTSYRSTSRLRWGAGAPSGLRGDRHPTCPRRSTPCGAQYVPWRAPGAAGAGRNPDPRSRSPTRSWEAAPADATCLRGLHRRLRRRSRPAGLPCLPLASSQQRQIDGSGLPAGNRTGRRTSGAPLRLSNGGRHEAVQVAALDVARRSGCESVHLWPSRSSQVLQRCARLERRGSDVDG